MCVLCRAAFLRLMVSGERGFRLDGSYEDPAADSRGDHDAFFFSIDGRHPARTGHARMAELAVYLVQQVSFAAESYLKALPVLL